MTETVSKRWELPAGIEPCANVTLVGALIVQPRAVSAPARGELIARAAVQQRVGQIEIVAYGEPAVQLAAITAGSIVRLRGQLAPLKWQTGQGKSREKLEVRVDSVEELMSRHPMAERVTT